MRGGLFMLRPFLRALALARELFGARALFCARSPSPNYLYLAEGAEGARGAPDSRARSPSRANLCS